MTDLPPFQTGQQPQEGHPASWELSHIPLWPLFLLSHASPRLALLYGQLDIC